MWSDCQPRDPGENTGLQGVFHNLKTLRSEFLSINPSYLAHTIIKSYPNTSGIDQQLFVVLFSDSASGHQSVNQLSVSLFVSVFYLFRVFTKPIINPAFQISCLECPTWADCQNRFVKHRTHLLLTQSFLYLCDIYSWHSQKNGDENIHLSQREVSVSFHELDLRSTMSSPRTGILSSIRFNSGQD